VRRAGPRSAPASASARSRAARWPCAPGTAAIAALQLLAGIAVAYGFTLWDTSLGREIPPQALSRVVSLDWFTTTGAMPVGFAVIAPIASLLGTRTTMLVSGLAVIALCAVALAVGDVRRLQSATP
jgi:hypothetical protein